MGLFEVLAMLGGLCLFLFGMNIMGDALERRAGSKLRSLLSKITSGRVAGFLTGCGVTAVIQSSSATTVMVVGFVNSGLMTLHQAINVIMGANVGTTITGWILSLGGISGDNIFVKMLKPTSFTPILAVIGIILYMFVKDQKQKDTGSILLGFAVLMFGMDAMSNAVSGLQDVPAFQQMFIMFKNPILGMLVGLALTAIIQSSSAAVGILQALALTGQVSFGAAIPIIMGTSIGTCVTAMLSSIGAKRDGKRAALAHLFFNIIGSAVWLTVFGVVTSIVKFPILDKAATLVGIAICNTAIKVLSTVIIFPFAGGLEALVRKLVPDAKVEDDGIVLDERLISTPPLALEQCRVVALEMANYSIGTMKDALSLIYNYSDELADKIRYGESISDKYEDVLGTYLVKLSTQKLSAHDSEEAAKLLKTIGDFERISDHGSNVLKSVEELNSKNLNLSQEASYEFKTISNAINEVLDLTLTAFEHDDIDVASSVEPLEQVIDKLKKQMRNSHITRVQQGKCGIEIGFVWQDLLVNIERASDHCSNIAGCIIETAHHNLNLHENMRITKNEDELFAEKYDAYKKKYSLN